MSAGCTGTHAHHGAGHDCGGPTTPRRLAWSAAVFGASALLQGLGGLWTGSLGLVSDSLENLNDVFVNLLALLGLRVANRREPSDRFTYGWHRLEVLNSIVSGVLLLGLAATVLVEAVHRFRHPPAIRTGWVMAFALLGLVLNIMATLILHPREPRSLEKDSSLKAAYVHAFSDSFASAALLLSTVVVHFTGWRWLDPLVAVGIVLLILRGGAGLIADAAAILMNRAPFDQAAARARLLELPGVLGVEDLRSWQVCSHLSVCTAHVVVDLERLDETAELMERIERLLRTDFEVRHVTVHFETPAMARSHSHRFDHRHGS